MKILALAMVLLFYSSPIFAQTWNDMPVKELAPASNDQRPKKKVIDKKFLFVAGLLISSQILDTETTHIGINEYGLKEGNPRMAPFVNQGRLASYGVGLSIDAGLIGLGYVAKKQGSHYWWLPATIGSAVHFYYGYNNWKLIMDVRELRQRKSK